MSTRKICSTFAGSDFSTSRLVRRNKYGSSSSCSAAKPPVSDCRCLLSNISQSSKLHESTLKVQVNATKFSHVRIAEMQQCPELLETILQWRAGDEKTMIGGEIEQCLIEQTLVILQSMRLIDKYRCPVVRKEPRLQYILFNRGAVHGQTYLVL